MGLGPIGQAIARAALEDSGFHLVAAVDPALAGRRLDEVLGAGPALTIASEPRKAFAAARGGVVLHATGSSFERVAPELEAAAEAGLSVVSTCEELAWPWLRFEELARRLDALAEAREVGIVGVGVNPGFALDRLPAFLSHVTGPVRHVRALRVQDAALRREALRRKVGVGMEPEAFDAANERDEVGHVGLAESAALAAAGCGFEVDEVEVETAPMLAEEDIDGPAPVRRGHVAGVHQVARGFVDETERVRLELVIAVGAEDPRDEVELDARPPVKVLIRGGFPGDEATAWAVVHAVPAVLERHGLLSVLDLPAGR
ncbi:MAG TPA: dihydrodipicolinate reductase [Anaeromyxobacteraceae bacterium]|nr:dihydrodipicolinate reductase [Anaeromyxobacteraceae bacterium]